MSDHGTIERRPYVGDSDILAVECKHGDYSRIVKGAGVRGDDEVNDAAVRKAEKGLADHHAAKHPEGDQA
jgi:hypothetical protein